MIKFIGTEDIIKRTSVMWKGPWQADEATWPQLTKIPPPRKKERSPISAVEINPHTANDLGEMSLYFPIHNAIAAGMRNKASKFTGKL